MTSINKAKSENNLMEDIFQAVCEQDVLKLRSQLNVVQSSLGEEIRNHRRDNTVRENT